MSRKGLPWFPGQFGRRDAEGRDFTGDPYTEEPTEAEPYAPATLSTEVTNPYGEVPAPPATVSGGGSRLPDGAAAAGTSGTDAGGPGTGAMHGTPAPAGYEDFYEPGSVDKADLRPPRGRRRRSAERRRSRRAASRKHGPRPTRPTPGEFGEVEPAVAGGSPTITVVPGGSGGNGAGPGAGSPTERTGRDERSDDQGGRWRRNLLVLVLAGVVVSLGVGVVDGLDDEPEPPPAAAPTTPAPAPTITPGPTPDPLPSPTAVTPPDGETAVEATVTDGPFEVEVLGMSAGLTELDGATATTTAEGEYVVVRLLVTATAPGPSYFLDIDQRLLDAGGTEHEPDARAAMAVDGNHLWLAELEQGDSAEGVVVFDVPAGTVPATFVVRASDESAGVPVELPTS